MSSHYIILADRAHLRIFNQQPSTPGQTTAGLEEVHAMDFPAGRSSYVDNDTDMAGRFQGSKQQASAPGSPAARTGMSIDERLPMQREAERRQIEGIAHTIEIFLHSQPDATWDFAAGPSMHNAILDCLPPQIRSRLHSSMAKDLVNQPISELLEHFHHAERA